MGSVNCFLLLYFFCFRFLHIIYIPFYSFLQVLSAPIPIKPRFLPDSFRDRELPISTDEKKKRMCRAWTDSLIYFRLWKHLRSIYLNCSFAGVELAESTNGAVEDRQTVVSRSISQPGALHELDSRVVNSFSFFLFFFFFFFLFHLLLYLPCLLYAASLCLRCICKNRIPGLVLRSVCLAFGD